MEQTFENIEIKWDQMRSNEIKWDQWNINTQIGKRRITERFPKKFGVNVRQGGEVEHFPPKYQVGPQV